MKYRGYDLREILESALHSGRGRFGWERKRATPHPKHTSLVVTQDSCAIMTFKEDINDKIQGLSYASAFV